MFGVQWHTDCKAQVSVEVATCLHTIASLLGALFPRKDFHTIMVRAKKYVLEGLKLPPGKFTQSANTIVVANLEAFRR